MSNDFSFDATNVTPAQDVSDPVPADWYVTRTTGSEVKPTKAGDGKILEVEHTITEGEYKGRKVWSRFNVVNRNEVAERIAKEQLSALCHATGVLRFKTHEQLREKPVLIRVVVVRQDGYADKNEVKAWKEYAPSTPRASTRPTAHVGATKEEKDPDAWRKDANDDLPF